MLQSSKVFSKKGYSLITWTTVFSVVAAAVIFMRTPLKRALQGKIMTTADYMFWTKWGNTLDEKNELIEQEKKDVSAFSKAQAEQSHHTETTEHQAYINYEVNSTSGEDSVSSSVEEGSQPLLKTFDLNDILP